MGWRSAGSSTRRLARLSERVTSSAVGGPPYRVRWGDSHTYRYVWRDSWSERAPMLVVGLIPSWANEDRRDSTVKFCGEVAARDEQVGSVIVVNMYARYLPTLNSSGGRAPSAGHTRATNVDVEDLVGPCNDDVIEECAAEVRRAGGKIVAAWGAGGWSRHGKVLRLVRKNDEELWCFGTKDSAGKTREGFPYHPSAQGYLRRKKHGLGATPADVVLKPF